MNTPYRESVSDVAEQPKPYTDHGRFLLRMARTTRWLAFALSLSLIAHAVIICLRPPTRVPWWELVGMTASSVAILFMLFTSSQYKKWAELNRRSPWA